MFPRAAPPNWWPGVPGGAALWALLRFGIALPLFVFWLFAILLLPVSRLLVFYPLALSATGSFAAAVYFGALQAWNDMLGALLAFGVATGALAGYLAIAERVDHQFDRRREPNPWFWQ